MITKKNWLLIAFVSLLILFASCSGSGVFEKNTNIPGYQWNYNFQPRFEFNISDTISQYNLYIVLRHTDNYNYNNIWLNIGTQAPGDTLRSRRFDLSLGSDQSGWEGTGMDDIWELRKSITKGPFRFNKPGLYQFTIAQIMRDNPLKNIISIGMRVEKLVQN